MTDSLIAGRYEIIKTLGSGGFGETFLATDTHLPSAKTVVVKRLKPVNRENSASASLIEDLFRKEAQVLEELGQKSRQIPTLYAYFSHDGHFYLVQEYIEGKSLADIGIISTEQCEAILSSLLSTLKLVHRQKIIRRDIKPENILIRDCDRLPVLIDFGAVKQTMGTVTLPSGSQVSSIVIGTRGFISPEQGMGRPVFASDLFALGLTMIYGLTGKYPIELPSNELTGELDWISEVPDLSPRLKLVLSKAITMDLSQRYLTADAMYKDLHLSDLDTIQIIPQPKPTNIITPNNTSPEPTLVVPTSQPNPVYPNYPPNPNPISGGYGYPPPNPTPRQNNWIPLVVTAILVALGVSGGFVITQQMKANQAKLEQIEREKAETQAKLEEEQKKREEEELKRQEAEKLRLQAEQERTKAEQLRKEAEEKARTQQVRTVVVSPPTFNTSSNTNSYRASSSLSWQPRCGDDWDSYSSWWAVKGPSSALSTVKNNYCGDALIVGKEVQAASFTSESSAWSFANSLSNATGYSFYVKKSR